MIVARKEYMVNRHICGTGPHLGTLVRLLLFLTRLACSPGTASSMYSSTRSFLRLCWVAYENGDTTCSQDKFRN
jgi:hypothetical protein